MAELRKKTYRSGWIRNRFGHLSPPITVTDLVQKLHMHDGTVRHWLRHPTFLKANVAKQDVSGIWEFDREKLWSWLLATGIVKGPEEDGTPEDAADFLGIDYEDAKRFRRGRPVLPVEEK